MKLKYDFFRVYTLEHEITKFAFLCLVLAIGFWLISNFFKEEFVTEPALLSEGVEIIGSYVDREHQQSTTRGNTTNTYLLTYSYNVDGHTYSRQYTTNAQTYAQTQIGDTIQIRYLSDAPYVSHRLGEISYPTGDDLNSLVTWCMLYLVPVFFLLREIVFRVFGQPLDGEITSISGEWKQLITRGRRLQYVLTVHYQFLEPKTGELLSGEARSTRNDINEKYLPALRTRLVVLYLNKYFYRVL